MAMFDTLIDDLAGRYGLGANARAFVGEVLAMVVNSPDGVGGFLQRLRSGGLTSEVGSWLGHPDAAPLSAHRVEQALGATALGRVANRLGLAQDVVATAMGYALPKIVGLLTPDGAIPGGVPVEVTRFLSRTPVATLTPRRVDAPPSPTPEQAGVTRWLWPALAALVVVGFLSYFWSTLNRISPTPPVAKAPEPSTVAQAPPPPPAPSPTPPLQPATQAPAPSSTETQAPTPPPPAPAPQPAAQAPAPASTETQVTTPPPPAPAPQPAAQAPAPASTETQATTPPAPPTPAPASTEAQTTTPARSTETQATASQAPPTTPAPAPAAPASPATIEQPSAAPAPPTTPPPAAGATPEPAAAAPTRLALSNDNGDVRASGVVSDDNAKTSILNALNAVFGEDKVKSNISVDQNAAAASWLGNFAAALQALKGMNVDAVFNGETVDVGGSTMGDSARDAIIAALKSALGAGVAVGALTDKTAAAVAIANDKATSELASLPSSFDVKDLLFALNDSVVNFASDSAEVPESMAQFLKSAAAELKQLKAGYVLEIGGYTDNTGDTALNLALSQKRADAVRDAFIKLGVDPELLIAKGYGEADPIASNDTPEGRLKNRRIEYHVVKAPT
jgi:OmpA-OmpF porin, OOP family